MTRLGLWKKQNLKKSTNNYSSKEEIPTTIKVKHSTNIETKTQEMHKDVSENTNVKESSHMTKSTWITWNTNKASTNKQTKLYLRIFCFMLMCLVVISVYTWNTFRICIMTHFTSFAAPNKVLWNVNKFYLTHTCPYKTQECSIQVN